VNLPMLSRQHIAWLEGEVEGVQRHWLVMLEMGGTDGEEIVFGGGAADAVKEVSGRFDAEADVVEIFFHFRYVRFFVQVWWSHSFKEVT